MLVNYETVSKQTTLNTWTFSLTLKINRHVMVSQVVREHHCHCYGDTKVKASDVMVCLEDLSIDREQYQRKKQAGVFSDDED